MLFDDLSDSSASPLSSLGSVSPAPPDFYPSPSSSQERLSPSRREQSSSAPGAANGDGEPPPKKRRVAEPKPRGTEYINFASPLSEGMKSFEEQQKSQKPQLDKLLKILHKKKKIVVIAGAGISVSAGVPDFRSSQGLFNTLRQRHSLKASGKHLFDASVYRSDASTSSFHDMVRSLSELVSTARPTAFHHLLASLAKEGRLLRLYTQNVDGIDTSLPPLGTRVPLGTKGPWPQTIQLHGGLEKMVCQKCNNLSTFEASLFDGPEPPSCPECEQLDSVRTNIAGKRSHGIGRLRPRMVLYNEYNPDDEAIGAVTRADLKSRPDAVIVVGTTLKVPGVRRIVREMCGVTRSRRDGMAVWINNDPEPSGREFESCWDLVIRGGADEVARHASLRRWDDDRPQEHENIGEEAWTKIKEEIHEPQVVVETPSKSRKFGLKHVDGVLTPVASPHLKGSQTLEVQVEKPAPSLLEHLKPDFTPSKKPTRPAKSTTGASKPKRPQNKKPTKASKPPVGQTGLKQAFKVKKSSSTSQAGANTFGAKDTPGKAVNLPENTGGHSTTANEFDRKCELSRPSFSPLLAIRSESMPKVETPSHNAQDVRLTDRSSHAKDESFPRETSLSPRGPLPPSLAMLMND